MDTLSNLLITIKNGGYARKDTVTAPYSGFKHAVLRALHGAGYIAAYEKKSRQKGADILVIEIKYKDEEKRVPRISDVKRVSKSSRRVYGPAKRMHGIREGYGQVFVSTPKGVMTSHEARTQNVGGELLFEIW